MGSIWVLPSRRTVGSAVKPIRLSAHARDQAASRGTDVHEIAIVINSADWTPADRGRFEARLAFIFNDEWNGRHYTSKVVRPVFVDQEGEIVVITVYVYFSQDEVA